MNDSAVPDFTDVTRGFVIASEGKTWKFPTRSDYLHDLRSQGYIESEADLSRHPDLVVTIQRHWYALGQTGCKFAQILNKPSLANRWRIEVITWAEAEDTRSQARAEAERLVNSAIRDEHTEMLSLIFPEVKSAFSLGALLHTLSTLPGWIVTPLEEVAAVDTHQALTYLAVRVALNQQGVLAWVLGLGPFEFLANTRRSPFAELAIRTKPEKPTSPFRELNTDPMGAHLADIPMPVSSDTFANLWASTKRLANSLLETPDEMAAKAKVTFPIPTEFWHGPIAVKQVQKQ